MKNKLNIDVAILGARMHYAVPKILAKNNLLHKMYTDFFIGNKTLFLKVISMINSKSKLFKSAQGRSINGINNNKIVSFDLLGLYKKYLSTKLNNASEHANLIIMISKKFNQKMSKYNFNNVNAIYGFNVSSMEIFQFVKDKNIICILEQMSSPKVLEQNLLKLESKKYQHIDSSIFIDDNHPYIIREQEEWNLADIIIAPSQFVLNGLLAMGVNQDKCHLVPYGVSTNDFKFLDRTRFNPFIELNILFVGKVGIHKGAHHLLDACKDVQNINLKLAGAINFTEEYTSQFGENIEFLGMVPRIEIMELYSWADLFVFPSLCEGSATVVYEAIANGLPVITTDSSGSIIENNINGCIVSSANSQEIYNAIEKIYTDTTYYNKLVQGVKNSLSHISLENYERNLLQVINGIQKDKNEKNY